MNFVFDLAFQVTLFVLFVIALGFFFHFLKENKTAALWSGFAAYFCIGLAVAFYVQNGINASKAAHSNRPLTHPSLASSKQDNQDIYDPGPLQFSLLVKVLMMPHKRDMSPAWWVC